MFHELIADTFIFFFFPLSLSQVPNNSNRKKKVQKKYYLQIVLSSTAA